MRSGLSRCAGAARGACACRLLGRVQRCMVAILVVAAPDPGEGVASFVRRVFSVRASGCAVESAHATPDRCARRVNLNALSSAWFGARFLVCRGPPQHPVVPVGPNCRVLHQGLVLHQVFRSKGTVTRPSWKFCGVRRSIAHSCRVPLRRTCQPCALGNQASRVLRPDHRVIHGAPMSPCVEPSWELATSAQGWLRRRLCLRRDAWFIRFPCFRRRGHLLSLLSLFPFCFFSTPRSSAPFGTSASRPAPSAKSGALHGRSTPPARRSHPVSDRLLAAAKYAPDCAQRSHRLPVPRDPSHGRGRKPSFRRRGAKGARGTRPVARALACSSGVLGGGNIERGMLAQFAPTIYRMPGNKEDVKGNARQHSILVHPPNPRPGCPRVRAMLRQSRNNECDTSQLPIVRYQSFSGTFHALMLGV